MSDDLERRYHEGWLGMVQPSEGLVVSVPVLVGAQCMRRLEPAVQQRFLALTLPRPVEVDPPAPDGKGKRKTRDGRAVVDLDALFTELLGLPAELWDREGTLPPELFLHVQEGHQTLRPTHALRRPDGAAAPEAPPPADGAPAAALAAARYALLVWDLPAGLDLDRPETVTGDWHYPPAQKFDRLLRHCRAPIGLLTNRHELRLVYAPHGESSGSITFRVADMADVGGGRPILEAFVMLLSATRWFGVDTKHQLPALLRESRLRQANVTNELAAQLFEALGLLLAGFEAAAERDGPHLLRDALDREDDHLYGGLLTVLLRLVFVLYAEDRGLLPVDDPFYAEHLSVVGLYEQLQRDHGLHPDSMPLRHGAWDRLLAVFRALFLGVRHGELHLPPRHGDLFDPERFPFLEGWGPGGTAPIRLAEDRAAVQVPSVDDGTVYEVLHRLLVLEGQRLSYRTLDVEQIGSVYEALMGYHVVRLEGPGVCLRPTRVWVTAAELLAEGSRDAWLQDAAGLPKAQAKKLAEALKGLKAGADDEAALAALEAQRASGTARAAAGRLVLQPGSERRRTSSHYTPRSLSEPIVRRTLEPLLGAMKPLPTARGLLELKVCDPAMGSGAFLVEACRFLADRLVEAWTREGQLDRIAAQHPDVLHHARRLVAQRCLYGVDKNPFAVGLAKLSLWLATLARDLPFTFLDHALRCGDSLVGLSFEQVCAFDWSPREPGDGPKSGGQLELFGKELEQALSEAIALRQHICDLANDETPEAQREKGKTLRDADDAMDRVRLAADVCVGAFFAADKDKARAAERQRRQTLVERWLRTGEPPTEELLALQSELHARLRPFHWGLEFPEVFYVDRPDPLEGGRINKEAWFDAFVGNPPFRGGKSISTDHGDAFSDWAAMAHETSKNGDLVGHFFRRAANLLGRHGTIGLIATKTIGQGDTRASTLQPLVRDHGFVIHEAIRSMPWPGDAAVSVAVVLLARGAPAQGLACRLDGARAPAINSRLRGSPERPDPRRLASNVGRGFQGSIILGMGFTLLPEERDALIERDPRNSARIREYLGGEELNSSPRQEPNRFVIDFGALTEAEAREWPDLFRIVEERVKPERARPSYASAPWWQFWRPRHELYERIAALPRCIAASRVTKHLCFSFQPTNRVMAETLNVFALPSGTAFAVLQSRPHEAWARLLSSSLEDRLRYSIEDCFEQFPFPERDPTAVNPRLEEVGSNLHSCRADLMSKRHLGLTQTYNLLKDPTCNDPPIVELRRLHEELDRAVLAAYREHAGWPEIAVPPYGTPTTPAEERALEAFEDEVIDRLFQLNAERAAAEAAAAAPPPEAAKQKAPRKTKAAPEGYEEAPTPPKKKAPRKKKAAAADADEGAGAAELFEAGP